MDGERQRHPDLSDDDLRRFARCEHQAWLLAVAHHPDSPADALLDAIEGELRIYGQRRTRRLESLTVDKAFFSGTVAICQRKRIPPEVVERIAEHPSGWLNATLFANRAVHVRHLRQYASGSDWHRRGIARNPKTPTDVLDVLARDPDTEVAVHVAAHRNASADALRRLAGHEEQQVRAAVASNPWAPDDVAAFAAMSV